MRRPDGHCDFFAYRIPEGITDRLRITAADQPYQRVKVDRQIVAIAITNNATKLISADEGLIAIALEAGLNAQRVSDLPLPDSARQSDL